jgi:hypothetical protein
LGFTEEVAHLQPATTAIHWEFMSRAAVIRTIINRPTFDGATRDPMQ